MTAFNHGWSKNKTKISAVFVRLENSSNLEFAITMGQFALLLIATLIGIRGHPSSVVSKEVTAPKDDKNVPANKG